MKQHITAEQMNEYIEIILGENGDIFEINVEKLDNLNEILKLKKNKALRSKMFSIGKMIEILNKGWFIEILTGEGEPDCKIKLIERKDCRDRFDNAREEVFEADELCDALWEAVKEVLE